MAFDSIHKKVMKKEEKHRHKYKGRSSNREKKGNDNSKHSNNHGYHSIQLTSHTPTLDMTTTIRVAQTIQETKTKKEKHMGSGHKKIHRKPTKQKANKPSASTKKPRSLSLVTKIG